MTSEEAVSALCAMSREDLEIWCEDAYADLFAVKPGKWLCKYPSPKLVSWFLMFYVWHEIEQEWKFTPAAENFVAYDLDKQD